MKADHNHDPAIEAMANALESAAAQFRKYEAGHRYKGTEEGRQKAETNAHWAEMCERVARSRGRINWVSAEAASRLAGEWADAMSNAGESRITMVSPPRRDDFVRDFVLKLTDQMPGADSIVLSISGGQFQLRASWPTDEFSATEGTD